MADIVDLKSKKIVRTTEPIVPEFSHIIINFPNEEGRPIVEYVQGLDKKECDVDGLFIAIKKALNLIEDEMMSEAFGTEIEFVDGEYED